MRRTLAAVAAGTVSLALTFSSVSMAQATETDLDPTTVTTEAAEPSDEVLPTEELVSGEAPATAEEALEVAQRVREGEPRAGDPSMTIALRDLWMARPDLQGADLYEAEALLARPDDGVQDPQNLGYGVPSERVCGTNLCVHYVPTTADAPPSVDWVNHTLAVMEQTWAAEVNTLGYRAPLPDGTRGGDARFDVYLKDLADGLYGFCAGEKVVKKRTAYGYCVLDNDYSPAEFITGTPEGNLAVTAAHEFFHAVQYAYDFAEDRWMMESTATWMEERLADDVNDNRQYLPHSQLYSSTTPLDFFSPNSSFQYGNWIFWEYLSTQYGTDFVRDVWKQSGSLKSDGGKYSFTALAKVLKKRGGLPKVYSNFAAANITPHVSYPEGAEYPAPSVGATVKLSKRKKSVRKTTRIHHMSSNSIRFVPDSSLTKKWKLKVGVRAKKFARAVLVVQKTNGSVTTKTIKINRRGAGSKALKFDSRKVGAVTLVVINASTRMRCNKRTSLACNGLPMDDRMPFNVTAKVMKGKR